MSSSCRFLREMSSIVIHSKSSYYPTGFRSQFIFFCNEKLIFQRLVAKKSTAPLLRILSDVLIAVENYQRHNYMNIEHSVLSTKSLREIQNGIHENISKSGQFLYLQFHFWTQGRNGMFCFSFSSIPIFT